MARIDSILAIVVEQRATELRMGTGKLPRMLQRGAPMKLAIPETSEDTLRHLLGPVLTEEREALLGAHGRLDVEHDAGPHGVFRATFTLRGPAGAREPGFDVVFVRGASEPHAARASSAQLAAAAASPLPASPLPASPVALAAVPAVDDAPHSAPPMTAPSPHVYAPASDDAPPLARLLARAAAMRASDVHLMTGDAPTVRVDGRLRALADEGSADVERLLAPWLDAGGRARVASGASLDLAFDVAHVGRFRLNAYLASDRWCAAVRLLAGVAPSLASLELPVSLDELVMLPHGLVIVCGPTGAGKSTTLAALAQEALRRRSAVLVSLEDPIEYVVQPTASSLVRQRQIGRDARDFASGLRDALREDPDVLLIGEMRDAESITLALTAAETGHLVLASLHSRSTASAVERIVDVYPPERQPYVRAQLADALRAIVAQRLVPRAHGGGRAAALEVLRVTHNVAGLVREGKTAQIPSALQSGKKEGLVPLERSLADLVRAGKITADHARAAANDTTSLASYLRG